jgi:hypothetical protein
MMESNFGFMQLLPTLIVLAITAAFIMSSTSIVEGIERMFFKKKIPSPKPNSEHADR